uniref:Nuclear protein MDM1 n=1 Tax=Salarias fasciatus TaxID=181472 RepID=A0A672H1V8_SALFA
RRRPGPAGQARSCSPLLQTPAAPRTAPPAGRSFPSFLHLQRDSELRARGQRSGGQRSEYHRQFSWKTPAGAASPILTAEQVLYSSSRSIPPFKKNPLPQETEYQRSFQGLVPPVGTRLRRHLEHRRTPLFHTQLQVLTPRNLKKKRREESQKKPRPQPSGHQREDTRSPLKATPPPPPPPLLLHRCTEDTGVSLSVYKCVSSCMVALRQQAQSYRQRAWGTNFSREHLSQLLSEHNGLWEPNDTPTAPPHPADSSSRESSPVGPGGPRKTRKTPPGPPLERRSGWGAEDDDAEECEGRLPTPRLKMKPVQRTHHDLTTPSLVSMAAGAEPAVWTPVKQKEAWSEKVSASPSVPSPERKSPSKPIRSKPTPPPVEAPPPQHGLHGTLRHADFQHNGESAVSVSAT